MTDEKIVKLSDFSHIRARPFYLGSRERHEQAIVIYDENFTPSLQTRIWIPALFTAFREALDNAVDEHVKGFGNKIDITYNEKTLEFSVRDYGRGIPIDWDDEHKCHKATLALAEPRAGRNFGERDDVAGQNGIGVTAVNMSSEWFTVDIWRDGKHFSQRYEEDLAFEQHRVKDPVIKNYRGKETGTLIKFKLSKEVFPILVLPADFVRSKVFEVVLSRPNLIITFNGELLKYKKETLVFNTKTSFEINVDGFNSKWLIVPNFVQESDYYQSTVNGIPVFAGGPHIDAFKYNFHKRVILELEKESKKRKITPNKTDITEGLLVFNLTIMKSPNFNSQDKSLLTNEETSKIVTKFLVSDESISTLVKKNSEWINQIYERAAKRQNLNEKDEEKKLSKALSRRKIPKLLDANAKDRTRCILFLTEGDSAKSQISSVRNPDIHGALPLRGKIMNVRGETNKDILNNQIISEIMLSIGLQLSSKADRKVLRYGKVFLAADQDPDGANITALLVNFFYLHWPELFDSKKDPFFYVFQTPFIIQEYKKGTRKYWYADNYQEYNPKDWKGYPHATRAKGLGSLTEEDWIYSLANPKLVPLVDDGKLAEALTLIFDHTLADKRKIWISLDTK